MLGMLCNCGDLGPSVGKALCFPTKETSQSVLFSETDTHPFLGTWGDLGDHEEERWGEASAMCVELLIRF